MNDQSEHNKAINAEIAENEVKRAVASQTRVSSWAVFAVMLVVVVVVLLYLTR